MTGEKPAVHEALAVYAPETDETKRVPLGYKRTEVGVIPEDWDVKAIHEISTVSSGGTPSRSNPAYWDGHIPWATTAQIDFNEIAAFEEFITEDGLRNSAAKLFPAGTLLMAMYGQGKTRGKTGILGVTATTNQACAAILLNDNISQDYIFQYLSSQYQRIRQLSNTGNQENLNGHLIKTIQIPIPPREEQRAIAAALSDVDDLISALDKLIAKKRAVKTAAMQQLLTGKQRLPGFSGEWEVKRLGDILERLANGAFYKPVNYFGVPFTRIETISKGVIDYARVGFADVRSSELEKYRIRKGDILYSHINSIDHIGKVAIFEGENVLYHGVNLLLIRTNDIVSSLFLYYYLASDTSRKKARTLAKQAVSQASINTSELKTFTIQLPSLHEQTAIAAVLSDMDAEIEALEGRREKTRRIKAGMMQELLTGRTRLV